MTSVQASVLFDYDLSDVPRDVHSAARFSLYHFDLSRP